MTSLTPLIIFISSFIVNIIFCIIVLKLKEERLAWIQREEIYIKFIEYIKQQKKAIK